jgi:phosphate starvation-inducible PhoH-like protein
MSAVNEFFEERTMSTKAAVREARKVVKQHRQRKMGGGALVAKTRRQAALLAALDKYEMVVATGAAGSGKTYLAMRHAIARVMDGSYSRIIITRPMVEVGAPMGFLPGGVKGRNSKVGPWSVPLMDVLDEVVGKQEADRWINDGLLEFAPIAYMRGRTLADAVVIIDEAQNCSVLELKTILTRVGENAQVIVTGDLDQRDRAGESGLSRVVDMIERHDIHAAVVQFGAEDSVRSALCRAWVEAFEREDRD